MRYFICINLTIFESKEKKKEWRNKKKNLKHFIKSEQSVHFYEISICKKKKING